MTVTYLRRSVTVVNRFIGSYSLSISLASCARIAFKHVSHYLAWLARARIRDGLADCPEAFHCQLAALSTLPGNRCSIDTATSRGQSDAAMPRPRAWIAFGDLIKHGVAMLGP